MIQSTQINLVPRSFLSIQNLTLHINLGQLSIDFAVNKVDDALKHSVFS